MVLKKKPFIPSPFAVLSQNNCYNLSVPQFFSNVNFCHTFRMFRTLSKSIRVLYLVCVLCEMWYNACCISVCVAMCVCIQISRYRSMVYYGTSYYRITVYGINIFVFIHIEKYCWIRILNRQEIYENYENNEKTERKRSSRNKCVFGTFLLLRNLVE